ncbi:MAG TPA: hypothetical protein VI731_01235 [Bacteroidia bacterium]|nr:hypothetical protein [Bacteroidia bacterium]
MKKEEKTEKLVRRPSLSNQKPERRTGGKRPRIRRTPVPIVPVVTENKKEEEEFPGYPHYPVVEDIMNTPEQRIGIDIENPEKPFVEQDMNIPPDDPTQVPPVSDEFVPGTKSDVSAEEAIALGDPDKDLDGGDDEFFPGELPEDGVEIPGAELDDKGEETGSEDEENNYYSLGGDKHDNN